MTIALDSRESAYAISFGLERINYIQVEGFKGFFTNLPVDPYIKGRYRFRRLSSFRISGNQLIKLPHGHFFQSKDYNLVIGGMKREYEELDDELIALTEFKKLLIEFSDRCKLSSSVSIGVHQIRISCSATNFGNPAPEGIHRDGCDCIGIFAVDRQNILGGETHLYVARREKPVFKKILNPGELLLVNDHDYLHFTTPVKPLAEGTGTRDVFVLTSPSLTSGV